MNKKGFTLIELLITISIMALILLLTIPAINSLNKNNKTKKYEYYANSIIEAAKVYVAKEKNKDCLIIKYTDLENANLIKPFDDNSISWDDSVIKYNNKSYDYKIIGKKEDTIIHEKTKGNTEKWECPQNNTSKPELKCPTKEVGNNTWTKEDKIINICLDNNDTEEKICKSEEFTETTTRGYIPIEVGGQEIVCPVNVYVDKTDPYLEIEKSSNEDCVSNEFLTLTVKSKDIGSGVKKLSYTTPDKKTITFSGDELSQEQKITFTGNQNFETTITVEDYAGNKNEKKVPICIKKQEQLPQYSQQNGKWVALFNKRTSCDEWAAKISFGGTPFCPDNIAANIVGKIDVRAVKSIDQTYHVYTDWYIIHGKETWLGLGKPIWIDFYQNNQIKYSTVIKDNSQSWGPGMMYNGTYIFGLIEKGTYQISFRSTTFQNRYDQEGITITLP